VARQKENTGVEYEHHLVGTRLRVVGEGDLLISLEDLDAIQTQNLSPLGMTPTTRFEPTRLSNFQSQRTRLIGKTSAIDEWFSIHRIIIYAKPVATEYPQ
jgi:hypothetical protein